MGVTISISNTVPPSTLKLNSTNPGPAWAPAHGSAELGTPDPLAPLDMSDARNRLLGGAFSTWGHQDDKSDRG